MRPTATAATHARTSAKGRLALQALALAATLVFAFATVGRAQVGQPAADLIAALDLEVDETDAGNVITATTSGGSSIELETRGRALHTVRGEAPFDEATLADASEVIAAATGYFDGVEAPLTAYLQQNLPQLAGRGERTIRVEAFDLRLDVTGMNAPHQVTWSVALAEVPEAAFPNTRHAKGPADARYVIREFSDLQCPFCARYAFDVMPMIESELLSRGDVRFEYHHLPLVTIHPNAAGAAEAAECVVDANLGDEEAFWTYTDALFERMQAWSNLGDPLPYFARLPVELGLENEGVAACLEAGTYADDVAASYQAAIGLGLSGTPTIFVGPYRLQDFNTLAGYLEAFELIDAFAADE
jgi:protein-disulfide isomerase